VIEHLYDPAVVLKKVKPLLKKDGLVIISTPNIANWLVRLRLLFGLFDYKDEGVMDKTHIRFFTLKSLKKLISYAGFRLVKMDFCPNLVLSLVSLFSGKGQEVPGIVKKDSSAKELYFKFIFPAEKLFSRINIRFFAYEFIAKIKK
jgi:hypothetical protein